MNKLQRYILRQLLGPFVFFTLTLTGIIWLTQSLRFVDLIINKGLSAGFFGYMTLLILPGVMSIILPFAVFAAVLYTYNRLNADSEIVVMRSTGLSNASLIAPAVALAAGVTLLGYALTLYMMPAGQRAFKDMKTSLRTNLSYVLLQEGAFNTIGGRLTVYIRERKGGGELLGILVHDNRNRQKPVTMMAERGALIRTSDGPRFVLVNGNRQQIDREEGQLSLLNFEEYTLDLSQFIRRDDDRWLEPGERFLHELFWPGESPDDVANAGRLRAEGHRRLVTPMFGVAFSLIALTLLLPGQFNRRERGWRIVAAVGAIVLVRAAGLGLANAAAKLPFLVPAMYANVIVVILLCLYVLLRAPEPLNGPSGMRQQN